MGNVAVMSKGLNVTHYFVFGITRRALSCLWEKVPIGSCCAWPSDESSLCHSQEH